MVSPPPSSPRTDYLHSKLVPPLQYPDSAAYSYLITPNALWTYRLFAVLFLTITAVFSIINQALEAVSVINGFKYLFFFTNLNLYSLIVYFIFTLVLSQRACKHPIVSKPASIVHALTYTLNCTFHPVVVLLYWVFLRDNFIEESVASRRFVSAASHGVTLLLLFGDVVLGAMDMGIWQIFPVIFVSILYTLWTLIYYAISGVFVYVFLDFNQPAAAYVYPVVFLLVIFSFFFMMGVQYLRDRLFSSKSLIIHALPPSSI